MQLVLQQFVDCAIAAVARMCAGLSRWHLAVTDAAAAACRSVVLGIALAEVCCGQPHA